jgi:hypothetical protein
MSFHIIFSEINAFFLWKQIERNFEVVQNQSDFILLFKYNISLLREFKNLFLNFLIFVFNWLGEHILEVLVYNFSL